MSPQRIAYGRTELQLVGQGRAWADFFVKPGSFDLLSVVFDDEQTAAAFVPPPWFGPEVTSNPAFGKRSIALSGLPDAGEPISVSDSALHHLLNMIEGRRPQAPERHSERALPESTTFLAVSAHELPKAVRTKRAAI